MAADSGYTRWWENYLVRYFLPSIAGMFIVFWLEKNTAGALTQYLPIFHLTDWKDFGAPHLLIWMLFGTLYCYVASYPCLVFHATRVLDFKDVSGNPTRLWCNPYLVSIAFTIAAYVCASAQCVVWALVAVSLFSIVQIIRLYLAYSIQGIYGFTKLGGKDNTTRKTSIAYAYLSKLSKQRSIIEITHESKAKDEQDKKEQEQDDDEGEDTKTLTKSNYKADLADSYKHLREHGNTAFIFLLELALCPILFVVLKFGDGANGLLWLAIVLIIWVIPSVFVHGFGQHLERRYSLFKH
jgi:hypothetical protein